MHRAAPALYLPTDAEMLAIRKDSETPLTFEKHLTVRASGLGSWAGENIFDAVTRIRGELGEPHISYLPDLPGRGYRASLLARTIAVLEGLSADATASGWRITSGFAAEGSSARRLLESDINVLADVVGRESGLSVSPLKIGLLGPLSLAASTYLTNGERLISDSGARTDLAQSLMAGLDHLTRQLRQAVPGAPLVIQFDEPLLTPVAAGTIPTSSGYRTLRSVPRHELVATLNELHGATAALEAQPLVRTDLLALDPEVQRVIATPVVDMTGSKTADWEPLAARLEAGGGLYLETADPITRTASGDLARSLWKTWRDLGLHKALLNQMILTERGDLATTDPARATTVLGHLTDTARALSEIAQEA